MEDSALTLNWAAELMDRMQSYGSAVVALSGGVDSGVVAKAAQLSLGDQATAVTGVSHSLAKLELESAREIAGAIGIRHVLLETNEFQDPNYIRNDGSRCYYCKSELYSKIGDWRTRFEVDVVCSGANRDDLGDFRPGLTAAAEHGVRHPLIELGFGKSQVRALAKHWSLSNWDKPASPCLSSRIAVGLEATPERLARVEAAEVVLHQLDFFNVRVRCHPGELARIELAPDDFVRAAEPAVRQQLHVELMRLGFQFVCLDLAGFRSGSLNVLVPIEIHKRFRETEKSNG